MNYPGVATENTTVRIPTKVNGEWVQCEVSVEPLQDHFGLADGGSDALVQAFEANRNAIEMKVRQKLEQQGSGPVLLRTADF